MRVLPTRWQRKPAGIEITSLSPYVFTNALLKIDAEKNQKKMRLKNGHRSERTTDMENGF